ncbi:unnamed protein product [Urochloa decumbens]|uniref:RING-type E3 ubiquitin transferase n=1 Tax=Urochloa decumbens TaxID=240449 RepID=A0ABC8XW64_9POAL
MVQAFQVALDTPVCRFKEELAEEFGTPVQSQRLWLWARRVNNTYRPLRPLSPKEEKQAVGGLKFWKNEVHLLLEVIDPPSRHLMRKDDLFVFLKLYDPAQTQLRFIGTLFVKPSSRPSDILPQLRTLADFHEHEEIELYEEVKFAPVMCVKVDIDSTFSSADIENGDIICYQKIPNSEDAYPYVRLFFQHVHDQKDAQMKIQALEEEIAKLKLQDRRETEAKEEYDQLKLERDTAVRHVDELRYQNRHIILDFSLEDLQQATEHFSDVWKVGDTEYGCVYKGIIHKTVVSIKLPRSQSLFHREVSLLREGIHPNVITIVGICSEASALVYEWSPNGNLEDCILRTDDSPPLLWYKRAQIIAEVCCTLLFLHSNKPSALVHGDLRPCNILIDANYRSKLCHFGMSDLFLEPGTCPPNMSARLPYMDPEFLTTWELTPLSDVYSLGVIILRLLTGMPPLSIAKKVAAALNRDSLHLLIDKSAGHWPYTQAKQLALLGLRCVKMSREKRPDLSTKEIMNDPQVAADGFTYEAEAIRRWLDEGNNRSPMTNMALPNRDLVPNRALRSLIQEYLQQQQQQQQQGQLDS